MKIHAFREEKLNKLNKLIKFKQANKQTTTTKKKTKTQPMKKKIMDLGWIPNTAVSTILKYIWGD